MHFQERIDAAVGPETTVMLARTWAELVYCLDVRRATNGAIQQSLVNTQNYCRIYPFIIYYHVS